MLDEAAYALGAALTIIEFLIPPDETGRRAIAEQVLIHTDVSPVDTPGFAATVDRLLGL